MSQETLNIATSGNIYSAFFYGTLMVPGIFYSVCYGQTEVSSEIAKRHTFQPAVLHGYCRRRRRHADSPGITEDSGHEVFGTLATGLTEAIMTKLDYFEGREYHRRRVKVKLLGHVSDPKDIGKVQEDERVAEVYVFNKTSDLEDVEWDLKEFCDERLPAWTQPGYVQGRK
uniref:Putative gamma-glutamylcyclotransferase n=1 Tax=Bionectria ochroleuca TaxID=29856 RepID=A0A0B7K2W1_BIOOC